MAMKKGFTFTQNSYNGPNGGAKQAAQGHLANLDAQNRHICSFGAKDPLPRVNITAVATFSNSTYDFTATQSWSVGDKVVIQGFDQAGYNGYFTVASGTTGTKVRLDTGTSGLGAATVNGFAVSSSHPGKIANVSQPDFSGSTGLDSLVTDMLTTRKAGGIITLTMNKSPVILTTGQAGGDTEVDPTLGGLQGGNPGYDAFADLCYRVVARYVHNNDSTHLYGVGGPLYVQFWNELKSMFNGSLNHWDYAAYVTFYNATWNKIRNDALGLIAAAGKNPAAGTDILIGGPYVHINFYSRTDTVPNHAHSNTQIGTIGYADMQGPDVIDYFVKNAAGFDFVCFDGGTKFMDLYECDAAGANPLSTGGLVQTAEGITNTSIPHYAAFTGNGTRKGNVDPPLLTRPNASQGWQDVVNWVAGNVMKGASGGGYGVPFFCNDGVDRTKPIWVSEFHVGNATEVSSSVSNNKGNRQISDTDMGNLVTDGLSKLSASLNSSTMVVLYWGSEDRPATQSSTGNGPHPNEITTFHEVDYPNVVYPTNVAPEQGGGSTTPVGTALGIPAGGNTIVGDGPSGR